MIVGEKTPGCSQVYKMTWVVERLLSFFIESSQVSWAPTLLAFAAPHSLLTLLAGAHPILQNLTWLCTTFPSLPSTSCPNVPLLCLLRRTFLLQEHWHCICEPSDDFTHTNNCLGFLPPVKPRFFHVIWSLTERFKDILEEVPAFSDAVII